MLILYFIFILIEVKFILCIDILDVYDFKVKFEINDIRNFI